MTYTLDGSEISALTIATTAKRAYIKSMVITYEDERVPAGQDAQVVWVDMLYNELPSLTIDEDQLYCCFPWSKAAKAEPTNFTVAPGDVNIVEYDKDSYTIVGGRPGSTTLTANWDAFDNYAAGSASINVTVRATKPIVTPDGIQTTVYMNDQDPIYYGVDGTADWLSHDGEFIFSTAGTATGDTYPSLEGNEGELRLRINGYHGGQVTISAPEGYLIKSISAINTNAANTSISFNDNVTASGVAYVFDEATNSVVVKAIAGSQNTAYLTQFDFVLVKDQAPEPVKPATPVFNPGEGEVKAGTQVTVTSEGATSLTYTIEYDGAAEDVMAQVAGDTFTFTVNYDCTVTVEASNEAGKSEATAIYLIAPNVPEKPTFSVQDGALNFLWPVTMKSEGATSLRYTFKYADESKEDMTSQHSTGSFTYNATEAVTVTVVGINEDGESEPATLTYTIAKPNKPTFNLVSDENSPGYYSVEIDADCGEYPEINQTRSRTFKAWLDGEEIEVGSKLVGSTYIEGTALKGKKEWTITALVFVDESGFVGPESDIAEFKFVWPDAGVPTINTELTVEDGTEVTVTAKDANWVFVQEYDITGELVSDENGNTMPYYALPYTFNVSKMHRRYKMITCNTHYAVDNYSESKEFFFDIKPEGAAAATGESKWVRVTSNTELQAGDRIVLGLNYTTSKVNKDFVMGTMNPKKSTKTWSGIETSFERPTDGAWCMTELPENTRIIELEGTSTANVYKLKAGEQYFTSKSTDNGLSLANAGAEYTFKNLDATTKYTGATIDIVLGSDRGIRFANPNFGFYKNATTSVDNNRPIVIFKEVKEAAAQPLTYDLVVSYAPYTGEVATPDAGEVVALDADAATNHTAQFTAGDDNVYTVALDADKHLCGQFVITVEGEALAGHLSEAKTDFHKGLTENCGDEHAPYVYVQHNANETDNTNKYGLVMATNSGAVALSTNPNDYHGQLVHHQNAKMTVKLDPFMSRPVLTMTTGVATGVDNVAVDTADADAIYYDMAGRRMQGNLTPGVYLEVRGAQARKVVVK